MINKSSIMIGNKDFSEKKVIFLGKEMPLDDFNLKKQSLIDNCDDSKGKAFIENMKPEELEKMIKAVEGFTKALKDFYLLAADCIYKFVESNQFKKLKEIMESFSEKNIIVEKSQTIGPTISDKFYNGQYGIPYNRLCDSDGKNDEIKEGDFVFVMKPNYYSPKIRWIHEMDTFLNKKVRVLEVDSSDGSLLLKDDESGLGFYFETEWCCKVIKENNLPFDWNKIPEKYKWVAADSNGSYVAYEEEPIWDDVEFHHPYGTGWVGVGKEKPFDHFVPEEMKWKRPE